MLFGSDEEVKRLKTAFLAVGADMNAVKPWIKLYERTRKEALTCMGRYYMGKDNLEKLIKGLEELEQMIRGNYQMDAQDEDRCAAILKDFKKMQGSFNDEFLISKDDKDFHTTLESVLRLGPEYISRRSEPVIFQSEIENLLSLAREGVQRERPELFALSFFYLDHSNADLAELNFSQKVDKVMGIYQNQFINPIFDQLIYGVKQAQALYDRYEGTSDKKNLKLLEETGLFYNAGNDQMTEEERVQILLKDICRV